MDCRYRYILQPSVVSFTLGASPISCHLGTFFPRFASDKRHACSDSSCHDIPFPPTISGFINPLDFSSLGFNKTIFKSVTFSVALLVTSILSSAGRLYDVVEAGNLKFDGHHILRILKARNDNLQARKRGPEWQMK